MKEEDTRTRQFNVAVQGTAAVALLIYYRGDSRGNAGSGNVGEKKRSSRSMEGHCLKGTVPLFRRETTK
ncbi:unnamed protein product [Nezara viridula]|uniref:Uncharacterized protein n=1 Tax=Nezara viridula TaxID=85310 RepID=A0A9P0HM70_NEZVI|nr:unnamed protein product [Nezara viridula]